MRYNSCKTIVLSYAAISLLAGCGGGGGGGKPPTVSTPAPIVLNHVLPAGDTFSTAGVPWDIIGVQTTMFESAQNPSPNTYDSLQVSVTFSQDVSSALPAPGASLTLGSQLGVGVIINTAPATSLSTAPYDCAIQNNANFNYGSYAASRLSDGNFAILDSGGSPVNQQNNPTTEAQTIVAGNTMSETFRLGVLGLPESGVAPLLGVAVNSANGISNNNFGKTDCAPRTAEFYLTK